MFIQILTDPQYGDILEIHDPNSGQILAIQSRNQYMVKNNILYWRYLPSEDVGNRWTDDDIDDPWWEIAFVENSSIETHLKNFWQDHLSPGINLLLAVSNQQEFRDYYAALTPNGRFVFRCPNGRLAIQPYNDNYLIFVSDLPDARRVYFYPEEC